MEQKNNLKDPFTGEFLHGTWGNWDRPEFVDEHLMVPLTEEGMRKINEKNVGWWRHYGKRR